MRKYVFFVLAICFFTMWGSADVFIKQKSHTAGYYYGGVNNPAVNTEIKTWFGKQKIAVFTENRIILIDQKNNQGYFINKRDKSFARTSLPVELSNLVPAQLAQYLGSVQYNGSVKATGEVKTIGKYKCSSYKLNSFVMYQGGKVNETDATIWVTTNAPIDAEVYSELNQALFKLRNYSPQMLEQIKKITGVPILIENFMYPKGFSVKTSVETVEISEKQPPQGIYEVPQGFKEKEKLTIQDLRTR